MEDPTALTKTRSFASSSATKFEGIIEPSFIYKLRLALLDLFTHLDSNSPKMHLVYVIVSLIRYMQLIGPALLVSDSNLWDENSVGSKTLTFLSIIYQLIPKWSYTGNEHIILYSIGGIQLVVSIYICFIALRYKSTVKISTFSSYFITLYMALFSYTIPTISVIFVSLLISSMISNDKKVNLVNILAIAFTVVSLALVIWIVTECYNFALTFRRSSLLTIENSTQNTLCIITMLSAFILMLISDLNKISQTVGLIVDIIPNVLLILKIVFSSTFVHEVDEALSLSGAFFNIVTLLLATIALNTNDKWDDKNVLILIIVAIIAYFSALFVVKRLRYRYLAILDAYEETKDITLINSVKKFGSVLATGFAFSHPVCIDYSIFTHITQELPNELKIWTLFAKFAAIYPENSEELVFIASNLSKNEFKGSKVSTTIYLIGTVIKTRESNLTPFLKGKIAKITKLASKSKSKLRNIWNLVLQCNVNELDSATHAAYISTQENQTEIEHLVNLFPNNRFVARVYSRFFLDIKADTVNHRIWKENVMSLQRGNLISADPIQNLGLEAFPGLPSKSKDIQSIAPVGSMQQDDLTDEFLSEEREASNIALASLIKNRRFSSIQFIIYSSILCFIFLILIPSIILIAIFPIYKSNLEEPLVIMYGISYLRNTLNMIPAFIVDALAANIPDPANPNQTVMEKMIFPPNFSMSSFGEHKDALSITIYLIKQITTVSELVYGLMNYERGNPQLDEARDVMFAKTINFTIYKNGNVTTKLPSSAEEVVVKIADFASKIFSNDTFTVESFFAPEAKTSTLNSDEATISMNHALLIMNNYIMENDKYYQKLYTIICAVLCLISSIVYIIIYILQVKKLSDQKMNIFKTMTTLPKTVISSVASSFTEVKKGNFNNSSSQSNDNYSGDMNKQEENAIKVFNSISEDSFHSSALVNGILFIVCILASILSIYFITDIYKSVSSTIITSCPHINNMLGSSAYLFAMLAKLFRLSIDQSNEKFNGLVADIDAEVTNIKQKQVSMFKYFNNLRFGGSGYREYPFVGMEASLAYATQLLKCENPYALPKNFLEGGLCFDSEGIVYLTTSFLKKYSQSMTQKHFVRPRSENLIYVWQLGVVMQYQAFFYPAASKIVGTIIDNISGNFPNMVAISAVCVVISLISMIVIIVLCKETEKYMKFILNQFLQCPVKAIYASPKVMSVISGDLNSHTFDDITERDSDFFNAIISKLNDIVVIAGSEDNIIINTNIAFRKIFEGDFDDVIGMNLKDFLSSPNFENLEMEKVLNNTCDIIYNKGNEKIYISSKQLSFNGITVLIGRNQTTRVMHQRLIDEEKMKSDTMLSSILPPSLVPRVQSGEKNISFAVQSVSVLFFDIVEFTPWCGSNQASYVMKMLNTIFKEMDAIVATHKTLSKIKYIGDCYMAGGGIFDETNQPAVHTKEMVEFGIEAIKKLEEINEINNEKLRIRIGINTGGPIIAGVLGTEKPTFEILGPTINIAQQMEHHGVPMKIHISRSVYELIYGSNFVIKERGEIEVKNGKMFTYLVEPVYHLSAESK